MPRITTDFKIINNTKLGDPNKPYYLQWKDLYLGTEYNDIYTMHYMDATDYIFSQNLSIMNIFKPTLF